MASAWADLCGQTIVWAPMTGRDAFGKPQYGATQTFKGRRQFKKTRVSPTGHKGIIGAGPEVLGESIIYILAAVEIGYDDQVYVQGDPSPHPPVLQIDRSPDETGFDVYKKVTLGDANG